MLVVHDLPRDVDRRPEHRFAVGPDDFACENDGWLVQDDVPQIDLATRVVAGGVDLGEEHADTDIRGVIRSRSHGTIDLDRPSRIDPQRLPESTVGVQRDHDVAFFGLAVVAADSHGALQPHARDGLACVVQRTADEERVLLGEPQMHDDLLTGCARPELLDLHGPLFGRRVPRDEELEAQPDALEDRSAFVQ